MICFQDSHKDNYERKRLIREKCQRNNGSIGTFKIGNYLLFIDRLRIVYCSTPKIASSTWKKLLLTLLGQKIVVRSSPHTSKYFTQLNKLSESEIQFRLNNYAKILFSREPLERVVSAYRNKLENKNNTVYNMAYGRLIIKKYRKNPDIHSLQTGQGTSFTEFSQYLIDTARSTPSDPHWAVISRLCTPCAVQYDYIGKYESINRDSNMFLREIAPYSHLSFPSRTGTQSSSGNSSLIMQYFRQLPPGTIRKLWERYEEDYIMFGYPYPSNLEREAEKLYFDDLN